MAPSKMRRGPKEPPEGLPLESAVLSCRVPASSSLGLSDVLTADVPPESGLQSRAAAPQTSLGQDMPVKGARLVRTTTAACSAGDKQLSGWPRAFAEICSCMTAGSRHSCTGL